MDDILIKGGMDPAPIVSGFKIVRGALDDSKKALDQLAKSSTEDAGVIKKELLIAAEAVKRYGAELELASKKDLINKGQAVSFKKELDLIQLELKRLQSTYSVISAAIIQEDKKREESTRKTAKAAKDLEKAWDSAIREDARRTRLVLANAKAIERAHGQALAEDRKRTADSERNSARIIAARQGEIKANNAVLTSLKALALGFSFQQIKGFIQGTIEAAIAMDRVRNSLNAATGSLKDGGEAFDYVRKLAYGLGLNLEVLAKQYGLFIAASNDTGLSLGKQRAIFESIAEVTRSMGLSVEDMQGVFVALQQILTKGTLQMEELRQQLGDRLPGALRIMAKSLGITQKAMYDFTKKSVIESKEAVIQFSEEVRKALVDPTIETALASIQTRFNNLKNVTFELKAAFGAAFGKALADDLDITQKKLEEMKGTASALGEGLGQGLAALIPFVDKVYLAARSVGSAIQTIVFGFAAGISALIYSAANSVAGLADAMGLDDTAKKVQSFADSMKQAMVDANDITTESFRLAGEQMASAFGKGEQAGKKLSDQLNRTRISEEELAEARKESDRQIGKNQASETGMIDALRKEIEAQRENNAAMLAGRDLRADAVSKMSDEEKAISKMAAEVWKETEAIEGNVLTLTKKGVILQEAVRLAEQDGVVTAEASETIKQKVGEQYDAYERLGKAVPEWLKAIGEQYGAISKEQQKFIDELTAAADKAEERLTAAMDKRRDSSGERYGETDLQGIESEIADAKKRRDEAVSELLSSTDAAGAKKAQKQVDEAEKAIEDRIKRREEIRKKIEGQNVSDAAPDKKKKEELQKQADELRSEIAGLEAKQGTTGLTPEELARLFAAKDALQDMKNELGSIVETQEQVTFGWSGITDGTDAATDAWEAYYALVQANAIKAKLALEDQAEAADDVAGAAVRIEDAFVKSHNVLTGEIGQIDIYGKKIVNTSDSIVDGMTTATQTYFEASDAAKDLSESTGLVSEEIGLLAIEARKLEDVKPMESTAESIASAEQAMIRINDVHLPRMIGLMGQLSSVSGGISLGGGGVSGGIGYQSDVVGQ